MANKCKHGDKMNSALPATCPQWAVGWQGIAVKGSGQMATYVATWCYTNNLWLLSRHAMQQSVQEQTMLHEKGGPTERRFIPPAAATTS